MLPIQKFEHQIKKGLSEKIYFLFAEEPFFLLEAVRLIRKNFDSITIETFESPEEVDKVNLMTPQSLFSEKRILLIQNFEKLKNMEKRLKWLKTVTNTVKPPLTLVIFSNTSKKELIDELNYLEKEKIPYFNLDLDERDLEQWIKYKANEKGINLSKDAIFYLIDITNAQPGLISSEIEKLALLTEKTQLDLFQIKQLLSDVAEYGAFDLISAIEKKDTAKAFKIIDQIKSTDYDMVLGALNWYFSRKPYTEARVYSLLYRANLSSRQARLCSLDMLVYELLKEKDL